MKVEITLENMLKSLNKTETDVGTVKEPAHKKRRETENTMDRVIDMKFDDMRNRRRNKRDRTMSFSTMYQRN